MVPDFQERGLWLAHNVLPHEPVIRACLVRFCSKDLDLDDVIQETYSRILAQPALAAIRYPRQYAIQTAKSIIIDHVRKSRVVSISLGGNLENVDLADPAKSAEERLELQAELETAMAVLAQLPKRQRETLILRRVEKLSARETAQRLNISERTVADHMERAVYALIKILGRGGRKAKGLSSKGNAVTGAENEPFERRNR